MARAGLGSEKTTVNFRHSITCPHFTSFEDSASLVRHESGCFMAKRFTFYALCIISTAIGAGTEPYFEKSIEQGLSHRLQQAVGPEAAVAAPAKANFDGLGDRVKCDVRYQELKISADEYQLFKRKCMGEKYSDND